MAFSTTPVDLNRGSNSMSLPTELARDIWNMAESRSAVMQLAQRVELPGRGLSIPILAGLPQADFVGETHEKPISTGTPGLVTMRPYKIACIVPFSKELVRDVPALYEEMRRVFPQALAARFDDAVFNGPTPGTGFDTLAVSGFTGVDIAADASGNTYQKIVAAAGMLAYTYGYSINGFAVNPYGKAFLMGAVDGDGHPLFNGVADGGLGNIIGAKVVESSVIDATDDNGEECFGWMGDWTKARYGVVNDIEVTVSDQATLNDGNGGLIHLWQRNMVALRAEVEVGFVALPTAFKALYAAEASE